MIPGITGIDLQPGVRPAGLSVVTIATANTAASTGGKYRVTVFFRHPADAAGFDDGTFNARVRVGDSGLAIPEGTTTISVQQPEVAGGILRVGLHRNTAGRLSHASTEVETADIFVAKNLASANISAIVSRLAFENEAMIALHWVESVDLGTGYTDVGFLYRGTGATIAAWPDWGNHPNDFFRAAFAVYREGLDATSPYWAVMCFFRVIDGAKQYAALQSRHARSIGVTPTRPKITLQAGPLVMYPFTDWIGKSASDVADLLNAEFRVPAAHGVNPAEPLQAADQIGIESRYWLARPVAQQVAHMLLKAEWDIRLSLGKAAIPELDTMAFD